MKTESITLFYKQEKSDKVYKASLEEKEDGFIVNFAYGRRGSTLKTGTKTQTPVVYEKAKKIYDKLITSKSAKGYIPDQDDSDYVYESDQVKTGIHCQLLNPIDNEEVVALIADNNWWMQEKKDGRRMLIQTKETESGETKVIAINRKGFSIGAPEKIITAVDNALKNGKLGNIVIDGEVIDETLYVFDMLSDEINPLFNEKTYAERYENLRSEVEIIDSEHIKLVEVVKNQEQKQTLYNKLKKENAEGVVFKKQSSTYQAGRPNSGGAQVKFKFYDTASVIVSKINDKRSVGMSILENGKEIFIGNVTISVNKEIPKKEEIIEVRYLYAYKGGSLYQPTFLGVRDDIDKLECIISQLKYKPE